MYENESVGAKPGKSVGTRKVARRKRTSFPRAIVLVSYAREQNMALRLCQPERH